MGDPTTRVSDDFGDTYLADKESWLVLGAVQNGRERPKAKMVATSPACTRIFTKNLLVANDGTIMDTLAVPPGYIVNEFTLSFDDALNVSMAGGVGQDFIRVYQGTSVGMIIDPEDVNKVMPVIKVVGGGHVGITFSAIYVARAD